MRSRQEIDAAQQRAPLTTLKSQLARDAQLRRNVATWLEEQVGLRADSRTPDEIAAAYWQIQTLARVADRQDVGDIVGLELDEDWLLSARRSCAEASKAAAGGPIEFYLQEILLRESDAVRRRRLGAYYTPYPLVRFLLGRVAKIAAGWKQPLRVVDPSCGAGVFLHEAAKQLPRAELSGVELQFATAAVAAYLLPSSVRLECRNALALERSLAKPNESLLIVGNPPYANFGGHNRGPWIDGLLKTYTQGLTEKKHNLQDDYIRFLRWAQEQIARVERGVVAFVVNNSFLEGLTHRVMRGSLLDAFDSIEIVNLHGHTARRRAGDIEDENVFGIRQGVALVVLQKSTGKNSHAAVTYAECRGRRDEKLRWLDEGQIEFRPLLPEHDAFVFTPQAVNLGLASLPRLNELVANFGSGVQTKCDRLFVDMDRQRLANRMEAWLDGDNQAVEAPAWLMNRRPDVAFDALCIRRYMTAPFDTRYVYYDPRLLGRARWNIMQHMPVDEALAGRGLVFMRQSKNEGEYDHFLAVNCLVSDRVFYSVHGAPYLAPWQTVGGAEGANLQDHALALSAEHARRSPQEFWRYYYGLFHTRAYRADYRSQLQVGFPVLPPADPALLEPLIDLGEQLINVHIAASENPVVDPSGEDGPVVAQVRFDSSRETIVVNDNLEFAASDEAWRWSVGGYRVFPRWLKQRVGQRFSNSMRAALANRLARFQEHREIVHKLNRLMDRA